jgi:hypothetical protein
MIRIGVGEVPAEASGGPVKVAGSGRQFGKGEALAVRRHVLPRWAEHAELG